MRRYCHHNNYAETCNACMDEAEQDDMNSRREPQAPPQGDADREPREFVTVHPDGTKEHRTTRGHRGKPLPRGNGRWQRLKLGGKR